MPGLVPGIHAFFYAVSKSWMAGTSPAMTANYFALRHAGHIFDGVAAFGRLRKTF